MLSLTSASPTEASPEEIGGNDLFQQINDIIRRGINRQIKNDSVEVGDKIRSDDGSIRISIKEYNSGNRFPVRFRPQDKDVLDDKEIIPIVNDFNGSSEYVIKLNSSEDSSDETTLPSTSVKSTGASSPSPIYLNSTQDSSPLSAAANSTQPALISSTSANSAETSSLTTTNSSSTQKN